MSMDLAAFMAASLAPREGELSAPQLAPWFPDGEAPSLRLRGLTGEELYRVAEARTSRDLKAALAEALAGGARSEIVGAIRDAIGVGESVPDAMAMAIAKLVYGSVEPKLDQDQAVRLMSAYPTVAVSATQLIDRLSGEGPDLGKSQASTPTPPSA